jgi:hypothetical protein
MLKTIPCPPIGNSARGLLSLLDRIGNYISDATIDKPFTADPPSTFIIDSDLEDELVDALGKALNAGAIIYAPNDARDSIITSLRGKRFRLSYLLAPYYYTPLSLGPSRRLRTILESSKSWVPPEPSLFSYDYKLKEDQGDEEN